MPDGLAAVIAGDPVTYVLTANGYKPRTASLVVAALPAFRELRIVAGRTLSVGYDAAADSVGGGGPQGAVSVDFGGGAAHVELAAVRAGWRSRLTVDVLSQLQLSNPFMRAAPGDFVPIVSLTAGGGLNRPGEAVALHLLGNFDFAISARAAASTAPGTRTRSTRP